MAIVQIKHKCISIARDYARKNSNARHTGRSVFIKRCYGSYRLIAVEVSPSQRSCRDIFAEAQKLASRELKQWNRHRFWSRQAKRHHVKGAHRMAVSYFYRLLRGDAQTANGQVAIVRNSLNDSASSFQSLSFASPRHASHLRRTRTSSLVSRVPLLPPLWHEPVSSSFFLNYYDGITS